MTHLSLTSALKILEAARLAAADQDYPLPALYVVGGPIGNMADITLRAAHVLSLVDTVACEDTRVTARLLEGLGLDKPRVGLHAHNEQEASAALIERLRRGERVAYVSDAGTPGVSDPGALLVAAVRREGFRVVPIPGVSSATAAISVAGDERAQGFHFVGFLPAKGREREAQLQAALALEGALVLFEAPHRVHSLAQALGAAAPLRPVTVCRELTKQFEQIATMDAHALTAWLDADAHRLRGEFVVVVHAGERASDASLSPSVTEILRLLVAQRPLKEAVALVAQATGAPRNALYALGLAWKNAPGGDPDNA